MSRSLYRSPGFKIVQKIKNNHTRTLAVVPSRWHNRTSNGNGILRWPTHVPNNHKLQRNADSCPGTIADGWQFFECSLRSWGIRSFELAMCQMREMAKQDAEQIERERVVQKAKAQMKNLPKERFDDSRVKDNEVR